MERSWPYARSSTWMVTRRTNQECHNQRDDILWKEIANQAPTLDRVHHQICRVAVTSKAARLDTRSADYRNLLPLTIWCIHGLPLSGATGQDRSFTTLSLGERILTFTQSAFSTGLKVTKLITAKRRSSKNLLVTDRQPN